MSRLYDRILNCEMNEHVRALLLRTPVIVADNLVDYLVAMGKEEVSDQAMFELPSLAPVFDEFFIECKLPRWWVSAINRHHTLSPNVGFVFNVLPLDDVKHTFYTPDTHITRPANIDDAKWCLHVVMYLDPSTVGRAEPLWNWLIYLDESGQILPAADTRPYVGGPLETLRRVMEVDAQEHPEGWTQTSDTLSSFVHLPLWALALMNCRNVELVDVPPSNRFNRKWLRKTGRELVTYRILEVRTTRKEYPAREDVNPTGRKQRLHTARGHFKTYTHEAPLFGHATGTYWWGPQLRGHTELGAAIKDYEVAL